MSSSRPDGHGADDATDGGHGRRVASVAARNDGGGRLGLVNPGKRTKKGLVRLDGILAGTFCPRNKRLLLVWVPWRIEGVEQGPRRAVAGLVVSGVDPLAVRVLRVPLGLGLEPMGLGLGHVSPETATIVRLETDDP